MTSWRFRRPPPPGNVTAALLGDPDPDRVARSDELRLTLIDPDLVDPEDEDHHIP